MAIVIKEIQVKATVEGRRFGHDYTAETLEGLKKDILKEVKAMMAREKAYKTER